jgi:hypothetical protein
LQGRAYLSHDRNTVTRIGYEQRELVTAATPIAKNCAENCQVTDEHVAVLRDFLDKGSVPMGIAVSDVDSPAQTGETPSIADPVAAVGDLKVTFRGNGRKVHALRGVSLSIAPGEILGLVGESGSGKSVLGFTMLGLLPKSAQVDGTVLVTGSDMVRGDAKALRKVRRLDLGAVFQDPMTSLNPTMRIGKQVAEVAGSDVVNIGDMLELWTNGAFVATSHRVRKVVEERYSFPLFFNVDYHTEVKPLAQFVSRGASPRPALRAGEHLFAQTAQTFAYLRDRIDSGELVLPDGSLETGQFGQQARHGTT